MKDAALKISCPTTTLDIARDLVEMVFTEKKITIKKQCQYYMVGAA